MTKHPKADSCPSNRSNIDEGFDFLGFHIRRQRKRGTQSKYCVYTKPSKKAIQAIKDKVKTPTYRSTRNMSLSSLLKRLGRALRGWAFYFRSGVAKATFDTVDSHAWRRLATWIHRKHSRMP